MGWGGGGMREGNVSEKEEETDREGGEEGRGKKK